MGKLKSGNITIKQMAERLGLSAATVSRILTGNAGRMKFSEQTCQLVKALAEELGYVPNEIARSLQRRRTKLIGVLLGNLASSWADLITVGMQPVLAERGYVPLIMTHRWEVEQDRRNIMMLIQHQVDGVICQPLPDGAHNYDLLENKDIPFVFLGDTIDALPEANYVAWESAQAAQRAVSHLIETGRRRIAFLGVDHQTVMTRRRYEGYQAALAEAGMEVDPRWVVWVPVHKGYEHQKDWIADLITPLLAPGVPRPDAIFALNDGIAVPIMAHLEQYGLRVPEDIAVVGMGDLPVMDYLRTSLSTVHEPLPEMGRESALALLDLIEGGKGPVQRMIVSNDLKIRQSSAAPAAVD